MITPHKYLNLDLSIINVGALVIKELQLNNVVKYDELLDLLTSNLGESAKEVYPYALDLLFLLDIIKYYEAPVDAFELNEIK